VTGECDIIVVGVGYGKAGKDIGVIQSHQYKWGGKRRFSAGG